MNTIYKTQGTLALLGHELVLYEGGLLRVKDVAKCLNSTAKAIKKNAYDGSIVFGAFQDEFYPKNAAFVTLEGLLSFIETSKNKLVSASKAELVEKITSTIKGATHG